MATTLPGWSPEAERSFKEVLYRFLEEVHCTRAALYLQTPSHTYGLAVKYGFGRKDRLAEELGPEEPLIVALADLGQEALVVNQIQDHPELSEYLATTGSSRMLVFPLVRAGQLVGFVDARDKGGRQPFEAADLHGAAEISSELLGLVQDRGMYPEMDATVELAEPEERARHPAPTYDGNDAAGLDDHAMAQLHEIASEIVSHDAVCAVALTVAIGQSVSTVVYSALDADDENPEAIIEHQARALREVGTSTPDTASWRVDQRRVGVPYGRLRPSVVVTGQPLRVGDWSLLVSVVGAEGSTDPARVLDRLSRDVATVHMVSSLSYSRRCLARRLLQPGEKKYPDLVAHSVAVSKLCWRMARKLGFDRHQADEAAVSGLLHDVGMRELDYDRLYRHPSPEADDRRIYRQHVLVGERILSGVGMEAVAVAVRHHHERWDGKGYPDRLMSEEIPLLARMIHVAEVFDVLSSSTSYRPPVPGDRALEIIEAVTGEQFDPRMVEILTRVVE